MNRLIIITLSLLISTKSISQQLTSSKIEQNLHYYVSKIDYWENVNNQDNQHWEDSLKKANKTFSDNLKLYTTIYPFTITQPFKSLTKSLDIFTSDDGLFRIYNWYTGWGGTMVDMGNLLQYKVGNATKSVLILGQQDNFNIINYFNLYHIDINNQAYYLAAYSYSVDHGENGHSEGIKVFTIKNGILDQNAKIIKTATGLHNGLVYSYTPGEITYANNDWSIKYDPTTKTITLPVVLKNGTVTKGRIFYKFTGQYFEKVKS